MWAKITKTIGTGKKKSNFTTACDRKKHVKERFKNKLTI
jgi:hypothetical protein